MATRLRGHATLPCADRAPLRRAPAASRHEDLCGGTRTWSRWPASGYGEIDRRRAARRRTIASPGSAPRAHLPPDLQVDAEHDLGRRARHAGAGRLPHPPGLRRRARARVRAAAAGRELRGDRARRRRHPLAPSRRRAPPATQTLFDRRAAARARADGRRRDDARDQVGLRPRRSSTRRAACASRAGSGVELPVDGARRPAWRRTRCRPSSTAAPTTTSTPSAAGCRRCTPRAWSMRSTPSASASPSRRRRRGASSTAARALGLPVKLHAEQLSDQGGAALAAELRRARRATTSNALSATTASRAMARSRHASRCCCPARSTSCARRRLPPVAGAARRRRADRDRHRPQPRLVARRCRCC